MTPGITWEPPSPLPGNPVGTSTLPDCLWPQANWEGHLTDMALKEAAGCSAHFSDRETKSHSNPEHLKASLSVQPHLDRVGSGPQTKARKMSHPSALLANRVPRCLPQMKRRVKGGQGWARRFGELAVLGGKAVSFHFRTESFLSQLEGGNHQSLPLCPPRASAPEVFVRTEL